MREKNSKLHSDEIQKIRELVWIRQKYRKRWKGFCRQIEKYIILRVGYLLSEQERQTIFKLRKEYYADYWKNNLEANSNLNEYIAGLIKEKHLKNDSKTLLQLKNELPKCMVKTDIQYMILKLNRSQNQER